MTNTWLAQWFAADQANLGGIIRRNRDWVEKFSSIDEVRREAQQRGWHMIETGDQIVLLCHQGELIIHC